MSRQIEWQCEFTPEFEPPAEILDLVNRGILEDVSWGNDAMPRFQANLAPYKETKCDNPICAGKDCKQITPGKQLWVWTDAADQKESDFASVEPHEWYRFVVLVQDVDAEESIKDPENYLTIVQTNDVRLMIEAIMETLRRYGKEVTL